MIRARRGAVCGRITLERPTKINALTPEMIAGIGAALTEWETDPAVRFVVLDGEGPRGFCAGGDVVFVYESMRADIGAAVPGGAALRFWADEYRLDARIASYRKPIVALMRGIVMGGGVGLAGHASLRIVTDSTRLAMPEVGIGLIPDVGGTWLLSRTPGETGTYLALTGRSVGAADALMLGLADVYVPEAQLPALTEELTASSDGAATIVGRFAATPASAPLLAERATIDAVFGLDDVEEIVDALLAEGYGFASDTASAMLAKSPTSLKLTLRALREARELTHLEDALALEYRIMSRLAGGHDFFAGIRATVIDKDRLPNWSPATLAAVADADLDRYFTPLGADELSFVTEETVL
jgi:enoyl-CoA hydratase